MIEAKMIWLILHLIGVAIGAGGAFAADFIFFQSIRDKKITNTEMNFIENSSKMIWFGLFILLVSGLGLFFGDPETYLASSKFITKIIIVLIITLNGVFLHKVHTPRLRASVYKDLQEHFKEKKELLILSGAISAVSWTTVIILGAMRSIPYSITQALSIYAILVFIAYIGATILSKKFFFSK